MTTHSHVATMAAVLATQEGLHLADEGACILALHEARFTPREIMLSLDEARQLAAEMRGVLVDAEAEAEMGERA